MLTVTLLALVGCSGSTTGTADSGTTTGSTDDTGTTHGTTDTGTTDTVSGCETPVVTFTSSDGVESDLTSFFQSGDYLTLGLPGTLTVCPGTWFSRVLIRADISVVGLGATPADTIMSGGEAGTILDVLGPDVTLSVENVTLDRGAGLDVEHNSGGGGVFCEQFGTVIVRDVVFSNGFANDGAGMYTWECTSELTRVDFTDNLSEDDGGALTLWFSESTLDDVTFTNNDALDGGAMAMMNSTVTISNSWFEGNTSSWFAAGIWVYESSLTMSDSTITGNVNDSTNFAGGLLVLGDAVLQRVTFTNNEAYRGGGLYTYAQSTVQGQDCDFSLNTPDDIYVAGSEESITAGGDYSFSCADGVCTEL